ncbi:myo-inositol 2-dehydrogenase/D-chiro-inositol 1-dehydrogenase [Kineococcus xinjiangensis]|uniref:Myo-inositol 2-dehydrogenase/D-chiro-inositol 1-dehydrogenase n=1 Tax=Kineococcus xinjiangensis TaxID=512762 RepID=A0A2S6IEG0_9ACTN|nr:Gfo/Idh/MocA family oxidoreductase [Kineococcus xinjiangensis]PPK92602.1 myo-inositol 2-dehydrogenase/D-chiro-inositol 1-dehydrogenase [Kineococcus xinjiangensis]
MRIGIAGVGRIGVMHARHAARLDGVEVVLADADPARARAAAAEVGARVLADVDAMLRSGLDGLLVAAGTPAHPELVRAGVDAGVPVLCEKPLAPDAARSRPLLEHIAARGGTVRVGHQRRFDRGYQEVRRALRAGELGWIHNLRALTCDQAPPPVEFLATSGGIFRDCSVHDFDAIRWLTGREVVEVCARGSNNGDPAIGEVGDVDTALALLILDDGTLASVAASRYNGAGHDVRLEVQGSRGTLVAGLDEHSALRSAEAGVAFPAGAPHATFAERFADAYRAEVAAFVALVRGTGGEDLCTPEDAVAASVVADAAQESLEKGAPVRLRAG